MPERIELCIPGRRAFAKHQQVRRLAQKSVETSLDRLVVSGRSVTYQSRRSHTKQVGDTWLGTEAKSQVRRLNRHCVAVVTHLLDLVNQAFGLCRLRIIKGPAEFITSKWMPDNPHPADRTIERAHINSVGDDVAISSGRSQHLNQRMRRALRRGSPKGTFGHIHDTASMCNSMLPVIKRSSDECWWSDKEDVIGDGVRVHVWVVVDESLQHASVPDNL
jgi:hypothetical protein